MSKTRASGLAGREDVLRQLEGRLGQARDGRGCTIFLTGEPGIGKTRVVEAFSEAAANAGMLVLNGKASADSAEPFGVFSDALGDLVPGGLASRRGAVRFECVLAVGADGAVIAAHPEGGASHDGMAGVISSVQAFVRDSFAGEKGGLGRLEFGEMRIVLEHGESVSLAGIVRGDVADAMPAALRAAVAEIEAVSLAGGTPQHADGVIVAARLGALGEAEFYAAPKSEGLALDAERARVAEAATKALAAACEARPVVLVLEDLHWADAGSLFVLSYLARNIRSARLAVLATARLEGSGFPPAKEAMLAEETATEIALAGLAAEGFTELVGNLCRPHAFDDAFLKKLASDSKGNPLFVVETIKQLMAEGGIVVEGGTYVLSMGGHSIPGSVEEVVRRRLDSLEPDALAMAEYAACAGSEFERDAALSAESISSPRAAFDSLAASGIVLEEGTQWRFAHALFQQVTYAGISSRWRAAHHHSLGAYYERAHASNPDEALYELARHFSGSGDKSKALAYCERAGDKAAASLAVEKALQFYERALNALPPENGETWRASLTAKLGSAELRLGNLEKALGRFTEAVDSGAMEGAARLSTAMDLRAALRLKGDHKRAAEAMDSGAAALAGASAGERIRYLAEWGMACLEADRRDEARQKVAEAAALVGEGTPPERKASVQMAVGVVARADAKFSEAERSLRMAADEAEKSSEPEIAARAFEMLGNYLHQRGLYNEAAEMLRLACARSEKTGNVTALARTLSNLGMVVSDNGDLEGSVGYLKRAAAILRRIGSQNPLATTLGNLGYTYAVMGRNEDALRYQLESLAIREKVGHASATAWSHYDLAIIYENQGDFDKAEASLRHCLAAWTPDSEPMGYGSAEATLARIIRQLGSDGEARTLFESALGHSKPAGLLAVEFSALEGLVRGDGSRAAEIIPRLEAIAAELDDRAMKMGIADIEAWLSMAAGDAEGCLRHAERGLSIWKAANEFRLDVAAADLLMLRSRARVSLGKLPEAREDAVEAARLYKERGREWKAAAAEERAEKLS